MIDLIVHVAAIGAVIGYVEYRLRSYAALMQRFDDLEERHDQISASTHASILNDQQAAAQSLVQSVDDRMADTATKLDTRLAAHEEQVLETEKSGIAHIRDAVAGSLRTFSDSVWRGVHSMAGSIPMPLSPIFTCYYCKQQFSVTMRERIGENDYCPEHGSKRKQARTLEVEHDNRTGLHTANRGSQQPDNDKLPWLS